jgi:dolichyl-phosphate beta-glucosyltransferase
MDDIMNTQNMHGKKICLVIPCYNEKNRLNMSAFLANEDIIFIFVNDCSNDGTSQFLKDKLEGTSHLVLDLDKNLGKANAVREGMLFLSQNRIFEQVEWIGFWDADLAVPLGEVNNYLKFRNHFNKDCSAIFGSRIARLGSNIRKKLIRNILGKCFIFVIRQIFDTNIYDSQCGAKIFKKDLLEIAFGEKFISNWIFDIEILLRLNSRNCKIAEYPLHECFEDENGSKVNILGEAFTVILDLIKIKKIYNESPRFKQRGILIDHQHPLFIGKRR